MSTINLLPEEEAKILDVDKYIVNNMGEVRDHGFNYKGYIINLTDADLAELFARDKVIVFNLDGEYSAVVTHVKDN